MQVEENLTIPPSARLVLRVLRDLKILDMKRLSEETGLPKRTLMYAIRRLKENHLVDIQVCLNDSRKRYYCVRISQD